MKTRIFLLLLAALVLTGCQSLSGYKAAEIHHVMSFPLVFTDSIHASEIKKETQPAGTVIRKAGKLTHETTIAGFTRTATYKDIELEEKR